MCFSYTVCRSVSGYGKLPSRWNWNAQNGCRRGEDGKPRAPKGGSPVRFPLTPPNLPPPPAKKKHKHKQTYSQQKKHTSDLSWSMGTNDETPGSFKGCQLAPKMARALRAATSHPWQNQCFFFAPQEVESLLEAWTPLPPKEQSKTMVFDVCSPLNHKKPRWRSWWFPPQPPRKPGSPTRGAIWAPHARQAPEGWSYDGPQTARAPSERARAELWLLVAVEVKRRAFPFKGTPFFGWF